MSTDALSATGLTKSFGSLVVARDLALTLPPGARHALIGPNGAGKTTLINLLTGMLAPDAGRIYIGGEDVTGRAPEERVKRGLVRTFQITSLFPGLSALEAVALAILERDGHSASWRRRLGSYGSALDEAQALLASLMLAPHGTTLTRELPYGRQRLLEIALALASRPKVLLLDEPAAGVPRDESAQLFEAIESLSGDIAVLIIEHDMSIVFRFASRIVVLVGGAILVEGTPAEIADDERVHEVYLGRGHHHNA